MREKFKKIVGPICFVIMIVEIVLGIIDRSLQEFIIAFLAGFMGVLYITDHKKENE